ncbi:MAG: hypothetical protein DSY42_03335 [Aquifex sp.]|nr:MAG: hypothetical protein DSY42_03335 [Aquifex sp.]
MEKDKREEILIEEDEIDLYELWLRLKKRWKIIFGTFLTLTIFAGILGFIMTPIYRAETTIIPVSSNPAGDLSQLASQFLGIPTGGEYISSKILAILKSRTIRDRVIEDLNLIPVLLKEIPEGRKPEIIANALLKNIVNITQDRKTGTISIKVEYKDPEIAKKIAEAYINELQKILEEKALTVAKVNRIFLEKQLINTERELKQALDNLANFQRKAKVIVPQEQVKGAFELYSKLLSRKIALQVELRKLESILSPSSPRILALKEQLNAIEKQLSKFENAESSLSAIPSMKVAPELIAEYTQIYMKVKGLQAKYETLLKMYEKAKLEEQKENIYVEVIDPPYVSDIPVKPKKKLMVAVAGVSGLFLGVFLALFVEWISEVKRRHTIN